MTISKIPPAPKDVGKLSDVLISAYGAISGPADRALNRLGFPAMKSAILVLVDGLGMANIQAHSGHAPTISRFASTAKVLRCEFPSTTVVSLAGLTTGTRSGEHKLVGYNVRHFAEHRLVNLLNGWERTGEDPVPWKLAKTISEIPGNVRLHVVAHPDYEKSGFTSLTMPGADFHGVQDLEDRVWTARGLANKLNNLVYLYIPELDQAGHLFGPNSDVYLTALEQIEAALAPLLTNPSVPVILTADHGMVEVGLDRQIHLETLQAMQNVDFIAGGDTRSSFIYLRGEYPDLTQSLQDELGDSVWVTTWQEMKSLGYVSESRGEDGRWPDLIVLARKNVTIFDRRTCKPRSLTMLGHHGSISDDEMRVPLIMAGSLAR